MQDQYPASVVVVCEFLGIKWYLFISSDEVQHRINQPMLTETIQLRRLTLFRHIACMDDRVDAGRS